MAIEDNIASLVQTDEGFVASVRLWTIREMIRHREFTYRQVAEQMGISKNWLTQILSGAAYHKTSNFTQTLDDVEDAITALTDHRGFMCRCHPSTLADLSAMIKTGAINGGD